MRWLNAVLVLAYLAAGCSAARPLGDPGEESPFLRHVQTVDLAGVEGRFDHFAADVKGNRLFLAALGNNTLEVIDSATGKRAGSVEGLHKPTGVAFLPDSNRVAVAGGDDGTLRFYDAASLKPGGK